jgi:adenylate cyclase class IV
MKKNKQIEVEHRARFDKAKYDKLLRFLKINAVDLGRDDKDVCFFVLPDKLLKVANNISKKTAKITGKMNKMGHGTGFEEIEISINPRDVEKAIDLFKKFGFNSWIDSFQKRQNFRYKGVEISVKYSDHWGYHAELEMMISSRDKQPAAESKILKVAQGLDIQLMSEEELRDFVAHIEKTKTKRVT